MKLVKVGFIGLGNRGKSLLENVVLPQKKVEVNAVCDICEDRTKMSAELVKTYEETKTPFMFMENCCFGRLRKGKLYFVNLNSSAYMGTAEFKLAKSK